MVHLNYGTAKQDFDMLLWHIKAWAMQAQAEENLLKRCVIAIKLTQQKISGYSEFIRYIKVPAGPRAILDLYSEAATRAIFDGRNCVTAQDFIACGVRILRGRVEATPDAEISGKTADTVITEILYEVFGNQKASSGNDSGNKPQENGNPSESNKTGSDSSDDSKKDQDENSDSKSRQDEKSGEQPDNNPAGKENASDKALEDAFQEGKKSSGSTSDADKHGFMANLRKEMNKEEAGNKDPL